jgi:hypothetical protein
LRKYLEKIMAIILEEVNNCDPELAKTLAAG